MLILLLIAAVGIILFNLPMEMRGTVFSTNAGTVDGDFSAGLTITVPAAGIVVVAPPAAAKGAGVCAGRGTAAGYGWWSPLWVYLPPHYTADTHVYYPLLLVNDGQDRKALQLHETLAELSWRDEIRPIVVAFAIPLTKPIAWSTARLSRLMLRG